MRRITKGIEKIRKSGYTLLEILLVVAILTVIITMAIPSMNRMRKHAFETSAINGMKAIYEAEELYYDVSGYYTGGGNQFEDLRKVDAIDSGSYAAGSMSDTFIKGYSVQFVNLGEYAQNFSCVAVPIYRGFDLRTFYVESDGIVTDNIGNVF